MKKTIFYFTVAIGVISVFFSCATLPKEAEIPEEEPKVEKVVEQEKPEPKKVIAIQNSIPEGEIELMDGFEDELYWFADGETKSGDFSISTEISEEWSSDGSTSCKLTFSKTPANFLSSFTCESLLDKNWEGAKLLTADFNNTSGKPVELFLEIQSGDSHSTTKTEKVVLGSGENTNVYFNLHHELTDANGEMVSQIVESNDVRSISFRILGKNGGGTIYVDNICIVR